MLATRPQHFCHFVILFLLLVLFFLIFFFPWLSLAWLLSAHTQTLTGRSRLNLGDIFYIIIAAPLPSLFMFCSFSRDFMTLTGNIPLHSPESRVPDSRAPAKSYWNRFRWLSLSPAQKLFHAPPLNEIHFSICYSCAGTHAFMCEALVYLDPARAPPSFGDTFSIIICTASKAQAQALWVMRLADAQKT